MFQYRPSNALRAVMYREDASWLRTEGACFMRPCALANALAEIALECAAIRDARAVQSKVAIVPVVGGYRIEAR